MPDYTNLPVLTDLQQIVKLKEKRAKTEKPLTEQEGRMAVEVILKKYSKLGMANAKDRLAYVKENHESAKKTLERMQKLLDEIEDPSYIPEIYKLPECQAGLTIIQTQADAVSKDAKTMFNLMKDYRANWTGTIKKICDDVSFVDGYIAIRTKTMTMGKQAVALANRLDEYVKRAELISKQAEKARKGADQDNKSLMKEADDLLKDIEENEKKASELIKKGATLIVRVRNAKKQKTYTGKDHRLVESQVQDIETNRKTIKGLNKTATMKSKQLEKLISKKSFLLSGHKTKMKTALDNLGKHIKAVEGDVKEAEKIYKELEKSLFSKK